ncbi:MAG: GNAT family N-acetyltransferase [Saprospiraceae bacterium]|nr:GNAT family N-acetyltransferase [Saprospiraceae bacterium]
MTQILETERLRLREFNLGDAAFFLELVNAPTWLQYIGDRGVRTIADAENYLLNGSIQSYRTFGFGFYLVELKAGDTPIGTCGLVQREGLDDIDIGFALLPQHAGQGYGFEAAAATLRYAREVLGFSRIVAITTVDNRASIRVLEKIGLVYEKRVRLPRDEEELLLFGVSDAQPVIDALARRFFSVFTCTEGRQPALEQVYELFIPQGMIIKNTGPEPEAYTLAEFIAPRARLFSEGRLTDFSEEETSSLTHIAGRIAQRFCRYKKSGILSGAPFAAEGMKTIQFVQTGKGWKISALAWDDLPDTTSPATTT